MTAGFILRFLTPLFIGGAASIVAAANWPNPNDSLAGTVVGFVGTGLGFLVGVVWSGTYEDRQS